MPKFIFVLLACVMITMDVRAADAPATRPATAPAQVATVSPDEFQALLRQPNTVLLDVRTQAEYEQGHLDNAININLHAKDFAERIQKLDKDKTYLVYCAIGGRSAQACDKMSKSDFPHLYNLKGGIEAWKRVGKPTVLTSPHS